MNLINENSAWLNETWNKLHKKLSEVAIRSRDKLPSTAVDGVHNSMDEAPTCWTNGFFGGMMWLMYNMTQNREYMATAQRSEELLGAALPQYDSLHHDVGFMWHITSGASYRLTGSQKSRATNLYMASLLSSRFVLGGNYIRAWNEKGHDDDTIIDTLLNLPLLYWASCETNDDRFKRIAMAHADMAMRDHVREDGSTVHIVKHNREDGKKIEDIAGQGYSKDTCWSRGLSCAIYGFALSYIHTKKAAYLDTAIKCADYFIAECEKSGYLPLLDFKAPKDDIYYDSTAGVISACGLIEIAKLLGQNKGEKYLAAAIKVLKETDQRCCDYDPDTDAIVGMGSVFYPHENLSKVHIPIIYGDFYYVEAISKLMGSEFLIW